MNRNRPEDQHSDLARDLEIDAICVQFERELKANSAPAIEQWLESASVGIRLDLLRCLVTLELEYKIKRGEHPKLEEYRIRFPREKSLLEDWLRNGMLVTADVRHEQLNFPSDETRGNCKSDSDVHGRFFPGKKIADRYRIVSLIGRGGMGEVYRADDLRIGQTVALKFLPTEVANNPKRLEYFYNEVRLSRQISHPNVCRVYDIAEIDGDRFLAMEFVDGEDLRSLLDRIGRLPSDKGIELARQMCAGLSAAHEMGVLHRDLKPANIMIDGRGHVRITDFGLATVVDQLENEKSVVGTPAYMAPEQLRRGPASVRSDIYSLGLILYEVFTGRRARETRSTDPGDGGSNADVLSHPSDVVGGIDPAVDQIIMQCLADDPDERPQSVKSLAVSLPGIDPLHAAINAGETPSPGLVAASKGNGNISLLSGIVCLCGTIVGLLLLAQIVNKTDLLNRVPLRHKPEVLEHRARQIAKTFGYAATPSDWKYGFSYDAEVLDWMADDIDTQPQVYRERIPTPYYFWYRQTRDRLVPLATTHVNSLRYVQTPMVTEMVPPMTDDEIQIRLGPDGKLLRFVAMPNMESERGEREQVDSEDAAMPPWQQLHNELRRTGWKLTRIRKMKGASTTPVLSDQSASWKAELSGYSNQQVTIEAKSFRGRLTFAQIDVLRRSPSITSSTIPQTPVRLIERMLQYAALITAIGFAVHNWRARRVDSKGTTRICAVVLVLRVTILVCLGAHAYLHTSNALHCDIAWVTHPVFIGAVHYAAIEPYVRRFWPDILVSWSRLFSGRWSDAMVGRDILVGVLAGVFNEIVVRVPALLATIYNWSQVPIVTMKLLPLEGPRAAVGLAAAILQSQILISLAFMAILLAFRLLFKQTWLAAIVFAVLWSVSLQSNFGQVDNSLPLFIAVSLAYVWIMTKFGLLAFVAFLFSATFLQMPLGLETRLEFGWITAFSYATILSLALFGVWASVRHPVVVECP